jgi:hypothetical protein
MSELLLNKAWTKVSQVPLVEVPCDDVMEAVDGWRWVGEIQSAHVINGAGCLIR